jgi:two-component system NtrC family response regulator
MKASDNQATKILIIDDDPHICKILVERFEKMGFEARNALTLREGLHKLGLDEFDVVFLDVNLPDGNGLDHIETIKETPRNPEIIIMTGESDPDGAELAMQANVWDYIIKSGSQKNIKLSLLRALKYRQQKHTNTPKQGFQRDAIVGECKKIKDCLQMASNASRNDIPVLITGETGTGKELFAGCIHGNSIRSKNDFIVVDCAALPEHLAESVLFGHSKGAFTSADSDKMGLIEMADKGTLFLDEVGELPLTIQKKFLRVLQEKRIRPVGSKQEVLSDFRILAATHRDLLTMVKKGQFREDLYYRIASLKIQIPPLRERVADIPLLAIHYINQEREDFNYPSHEISGGFMEELMRFNWPGNVRELLNTLYSACSNAYGEAYLFPKHLPTEIRTFNIKNKITGKESSLNNRACGGKTSTILCFKDHIETTKYEYVQTLLSATQGDIKQALTLSGLSRSHLYRLLEQYKIPLP